VASSHPKMFTFLTLPLGWTG